jgi:hypothetical protein
MQFILYVWPDNERSPAERIGFKSIVSHNQIINRAAYSPSIASSGTTRVDALVLINQELETKTTAERHCT